MSRMDVKELRIVRMLKRMNEWGTDSVNNIKELIKVEEALIKGW